MRGQIYGEFIALNRGGTWSLRCQWRRKRYAAADSCESYLDSTRSLRRPELCVKIKKCEYHDLLHIHHTNDISDVRIVAFHIIRVHEENTVRSIKMLKRSFFRDSLCREKKWCLREYHCYRLLPRVHVYTVLLWQCECNWATSIFCRICLLRSLKSTAETTNWRTVATLARSFNFCHCLAIRHDYLFKR